MMTRFARLRCTALPTFLLAVMLLALAAVLAGKVVLTDATLVTLSGGNVDPLKFADIITE